MSGAPELIVSNRRPARVSFRTPGFPGSGVRAHSPGEGTGSKYLESASASCLP